MDIAGYIHDARRSDRMAAGAGVEVVGSSVARREADGLGCGVERGDRTSRSLGGRLLLIVSSM